MSKPVMSDLFTDSGRRNRLSYFLCCLALLGISALAGLAALVVVVVASVASLPESLSVGLGVIIIIGISIAWAVASLFIGAQRCRDFGWSGWAVFLTFVPLIGWIFSIAIFFVPGDKGSNLYGSDPLAYSPYASDQFNRPGPPEPVTPTRGNASLAEVVQPKVPDYAQSGSAKAQSQTMGAVTLFGFDDHGHRVEFNLSASQLGQPRGVVIGRSASDAGVRIDDPGVSRSHLSLHLTPDGFSVRDLGSTNGTTCNGSLLESHRPGPLRDGDQLVIGGHRLTVKIEG